MRQLSTGFNGRQSRVQCIPLPTQSTSLVSFWLATSTKVASKELMNVCLLVHAARCQFVSCPLPPQLEALEPCLISSPRHTLLLYRLYRRTHAASACC